MVKVILISPSGVQRDLFPEHVTIRGVLNQLNDGMIGAAGTVNGKRLTEEDLDRPLRKFSSDSVVRIDFLHQAPESPETALEEDAGGSGNHESEYQLLAGIKKCLDEAQEKLKKLESMILPF